MLSETDDHEISDRDSGAPQHRVCGRRADAGYVLSETDDHEISDRDSGRRNIGSAGAARPPATC